MEYLEFLKNLQKWDKRFLELAKFIAQWSKDPSTKTGAVIVRPDRTIASVGYNGFPRKCYDSEELYADRETKYSRIIHCEVNAVLNSKESVRGYTLYTWPFMSCDRCAAQMIQAGISRCIAPKLPDHLKERWGEIVDRSKALFSEAGVSVELY